MTDLIDLSHSKYKTSQSFTIKAAEKELRLAEDKSKRGFGKSSCWVLPDDSKYKFDHGCLIQSTGKKKFDTDK